MAFSIAPSSSAGQECKIDGGWRGGGMERRCRSPRWASYPDSAAQTPQLSAAAAPRYFWQGGSCWWCKTLFLNVETWEGENTALLEDVFPCLGSQIHKWLGYPQFWVPSALWKKIHISVEFFMEPGSWLPALLATSPVCYASHRTGKMTQGSKENLIHWTKPWKRT